MASPQTQNGFTRIANELLEALCRARLSGTEYMSVLWIARKSYGWNRKKTNPIGVREMARELESPYASVRLALQVLIDNKIIAKDESGCYSINKNYDRWIEHSVQTPGRSSGQPVSHPEVVSQLASSGQPVSQSGQPVSQSGQPVSQYYKDERQLKTTKDNSKDIPPQLESVKAYCLERSNKVDAQRWMDHYTSNGWKVGRNPMKDWRAAVRTWEKNDGFNAKYGGASNVRTQPVEGKYAGLEKTI